MEYKGVIGALAIVYQMRASSHITANNYVISLFPSGLKLETYLKKYGHLVSTGFFMRMTDVVEWNSEFMMMATVTNGEGVCRVSCNLCNRCWYQIIRQ